MVLELLAAYGLIIGTIVGTGHALQHMDGEPQITGSIEVPSLSPSGAIARERDVVPIDTLSELREEQSVPEKTIPTADEAELKKQPGTTDTKETPVEPSVTPVSFIVPDNVEDGAKTTMDLDAGVPEARQEKPYDIFEAVGFEDDEDFESWAK